VGGESWIDVATTKANHATVLTYNFAIGGATVDPSISPSQSGSTLVSQVNTFSTWNSASKRAWASSNTLFSFWVSDTILLSSTNTESETSHSSVLMTSPMYSGRAPPTTCPVTL
jgi:hypothetical protein